MMLRAILFFVLMMTSCGNNSDKTYKISTLLWGSTSSNVGFYMTDAPPSPAGGGTYKAVNITVKEIDVNMNSDDTGWKEIPLQTALPLNLLELQNQSNRFLVDTQLAPGTYQQIRLILEPSTSNVMVTTDGVDKTYPLTIPSGSQTGIKINLNGFTVDPAKKYAVIFDFKTDALAHVTGNGTYKLQPVIQVKIGTVSSEGATVVTEDKGSIGE